MKGKEAAAAANRRLNALTEERDRLVVDLARAKEQATAAKVDRGRLTGLMETVADLNARLTKAEASTESAVSMALDDAERCHEAHVAVVAKAVSALLVRNRPTLTTSEMDELREVLGPEVLHAWLESEGSVGNRQRRRNLKEAPPSHLFKLTEQEDNRSNGTNRGGPRNRQ